MNELLFSWWFTLGILLVCTLVWAKAQAAVATSSLFNHLIFKLLPYYRGTSERLGAILLGILYYMVGIGCIAGLSIIYRIQLQSLFHFNLEMLKFCVLGIVAGLSLTSLATTLYMTVLQPPIDLGEIVRNTPWIAGIRKLPPVMRAVAPGLAAFIEELLFRGVVLLVLSQVFPKPFIVMTIATALFFLHQVLQTTNRHQAVMIGTSSIIISMIGTLLVLDSGSLVPAIAAHVAFLILYL